MGMDKQAVGVFQQGMGLADDVMGLVNGSSRNSAEAEANARMRETDAMGEAREVQRRALNDARAVRDEREQVRSGRNAAWGQSNLAMSGSKSLVREGNKLQDKQDEEDVRFEGEMASQEVLNKGRHGANMTRIGNGGSANRSTLSLGSKIYRQGR